MKAFKNKESIKAKYVTRVKAHMEADQIIKGRYWEGGKGCAVGCTIEGSDHEKYEKELGIPKEVASLEDVIFEELPNEMAMKFPLRFLEAVPIGADLSKVTAEMVVWQFEDEKHGLRNIKEVKEDKECLAICEKVVDAYKRVLKGEKVSDKEWIELYEEADRAWAGAWARAWAGAWARAWARAWAGAEYDERIIAMADKFINLIENCK